MPQPAPPVPQVPAGWKPVQADMDLWVTNSFSFLAKRPNFRVQRAAAQSLAGGSFTLIQPDTVIEDPYSGWSAVTTGSQPAFSWLCPPSCGGWYEASMSGQAASQGSGTTNQVMAGLALNGSLWQYGSDDWAPASAPGGSSGALQVPLLPGDYVQMWMFATVAVSTPTTAGELPSFELCWVST